jgi:hypothetical protein
MSDLELIDAVARKTGGHSYEIRQSANHIEPDAEGS